MPAASAITYNRLAFLSITPAGGAASATNLAGDAQMFGGVTEGLPTQSITAVNDANTKMAAPDIPDRVLSLILYATPAIETLFRGMKDATTNRFGGILGSEFDIRFQLLHEASDPPGTAADATPLGVCESCYASSPGMFPGGELTTQRIYVVNWHVNGAAYWLGA